MTIATRITAALLATAAALVPVPQAQASSTPTYTTQQLISLGVEPSIANNVAALNIPVYDGGQLGLCRPTESGRFLGVYNYKYNAILMCSNNITSAAGFVKTFTHEVVHLIQDCRGGLWNLEMRTGGGPEYIQSLWRKLPEYKQINIKKSYPRSEWNDEIEAFYWEERPAVVAEALVNACF